MLISVKKNLHENDIVHEVQALKNASKLCRCVDNSRKKLRGPFLALVAMDAFEKKEKTTEQWIFEKLEEVYSEGEDYFDDFGKPMPEEVKMQNMYLVGENLYDCFNRMVLEEE